MAPDDGQTRDGPLILLNYLRGQNPRNPSPSCSDKCVLATKRLGKVFRLMPTRTAVATVAIILGIVIVAAVAGMLFFAGQSNSIHIASSTQSATSVTSVSTIISSPPSASTVATNSTTSELCYQGVIPANSSISDGQSSYYRATFNVTQKFDSWNWKSLSTFAVGPYKFDLVGSQNSQTIIYLEPQIFINVTNSQGQMQRMDSTNLGGWNGSVWPPDMSGGPNVLFGGNVTIQWLFPCNSQSVFLEVTTQ